MQILETQSAVLTNYEVLNHIHRLQAKYQREDRVEGARAVPRELASVLRDVSLQLTRPTQPLAPLAANPLNPSSPSSLMTQSKYSPHAIRLLNDRLVIPYDLEKGEMVQIFNLRPRTRAELEVILDEAEQRFGQGDEEKAGMVLDEILGVVGEVLGG